MNSQPLLPLSVRLACSIAAIVVAVMVAVSLPQQLTHQAQMNEDAAVLLNALAQPISIALQSARDAKDLVDEIEQFRLMAGSILGHPPTVGVVTETGTQVFGNARELTSAPIVIAATGPGAQKSIRVVTDPRQFEIDGSLPAYWLHVLVTVVVLSGSLYLAVHHLVARPLERLLDGVRLMEMGYWGEVAEASGAWEIRWLTRRFREMARHLEATVESLAAAERRGSRTRGATAFPDVPSSSNCDEEMSSETESSNFGEIRLGLLANLEELEGIAINDPRAKDMAEEVLNRDPALAEKIGEMDLKTHIEDTAAAILDPDGLRALRRDIGRLAPKLLKEADATEQALLESLGRARISVIHIQRRLKGPGSVWRKMQRKGLVLGQVHDLLAMRVVVASTEQCYGALHAIHSELSPVVGRFKDYVAEPKPNGYQSIHTSVRLRSGDVCEIQIRSLQMHRMAERGDSSHWRYRSNDFVQQPEAGRGPLGRHLT